MSDKAGEVVVKTNPRRSLKQLLRPKLVGVVLAGLAIIAGITLIAMLLAHKYVQKSRTSVLTPSQVNQTVSKQIQGHQLAAAETTLKNQVAANPTESNYILLATVQAGQGNYKTAIATLGQAQAKFGLDYTLTVQFAQIYLQAGDYKNAITYYQKEINMIQAKPGLVSNPQQTTSQLQATIASLQKAVQ